MTDFPLPDLSDGRPAPTLPASSQVSIIGANGAGKTRFMHELIDRCGDKAYCLSALSASYPERQPSKRPGSIDMLYEEAVRKKPYLSTAALSELDKLAYMLIADEFEELMHQKAVRRAGIRLSHQARTRLDIVVDLWERIFPGNQILCQDGTLLFANECDTGTITASRLSQGEKAALYYMSAVLYAMPDAVVFIDSPSLFMHPSMLANFWNAVEELRPDCRFVYNTVDMDFVASRTDTACIWIKSFDAGSHTWNYEILEAPMLSEELFLDIIGSRKPILFIEGDATHSIDGRLYPLVFTDYTVKPLGSCNKVIEATRSFNDLKYMHHLDSHGIVDRDRRTTAEVDYLRNKRVFVPEVAEIENIFLLPDVVRVMAERRGKDANSVVEKVRKAVMGMFRVRFDEQALLHVRHKVKRDVECRVDAKFTCITALETHLRSLVDKLRPRDYYNQLREEFRTMLVEGDYCGVLRVFNHKPMLADCGVAQMLGYKNKEDYITGVINTLKGSGRLAEELRLAVKRCFGLGSDETYLPGHEPAPGKKKAQAPTPAPEGAGEQMPEKRSRHHHAKPKAKRENGRAGSRQGRKKRPGTKGNGRTRRY